MKTILKLLLGVISIEPIAFFLLFFVWLLPAFGRHANGHSLFRERFHTIVPFAIASSVMIIALLLIYTIVLARRPDLTTVEKIGVPLAIVMTNGILLPLIWWLYIWRESNLRMRGVPYIHGKRITFVL